MLRPISGTKASRWRSSRPFVRACAEALESRVLFATYLVTSGADSGPNTLRDAVTQANASPEDDTITLNTSVSLTGAELEFTAGSGRTTISAATSAGVQINHGPGAGRIFHIDAGASAVLNGLNMRYGSVSGGSGGNILNAGSLTMNDCLSSFNSSAQGAGIFSDAGSTLVVNRCYIGGNTASSNKGGGICVIGATSVSLTNCTIDGNWGDGVYAINSSVMMVNCTVRGNTNGYGINHDFPSTGTFDLRNNLSAFNTGTTRFPADLAGLFSPASACNLIRVVGGLGAGIVGRNGNLTGTESAPFEPMLGSSGGYGGTIPVYPLLPGSPGIDASESLFAPATDARGYARTFGGAADIGSFESRGFLLAAGGAGQSAPMYTYFSSPISVVVNSQYGNEPVSGGVVTLTGPTSGAGGTFNSPLTITAGSVSTSVLSNGTPGTFAITASTSGASINIPLTITNAPPPALIVSTTSDSATGSSMSLRQAINYANARPGTDTITFDPAVFTPGSLHTINVTNGRMVLTDSVIITAPGAAVVQLLANKTTFGVLRVNEGVAANISGMAIDNGFTKSGDGGKGGGIANLGSLSLNNCTFNGDSASSFGGAIYSGPSSSLTVNTCTFTNSAGTSGGAIYLDTAAQASLSNSTISANQSNNGGGIYSNASNLVLYNCTIDGNLVDSGIRGINGTLTVVNCTITNNQSGIDFSGTTGSAILHNTLVALNSSYDLRGTRFSALSSHNFIRVHNASISNFPVASNGNQSGTEQNLNIGTLADNGGPTMTIALLPGSPAFNAGDDSKATAAGLTNDQRGYNRFVGTIDIGAYERAPALAYMSGSTLSVQFDGSPTPVTIAFSGANITVTQGATVLTFLVSGINDIAITGTGNDDFLQINGSLAKPMTFANGNGHDSLRLLSGASFHFNSDLSPALSNVALTIDAGANATFHTPQHLANLVVNGNADVSAGGSNVLITSAISVAGKLNLRDNNLIVNYSTLSPIGTWSGNTYNGVLGLVQSGRNGGSWNGVGINSSAATSSLYALAVAEASQAIGPAGGMFETVSVDSSSILVKFTYAGDANLDGKINIDDYVPIDHGVVAALTGWSNGDFNYDGKVNIDDYTLIDSVLPNQGPPL